MSKSIQLKGENENCYPKLPFKTIAISFGEYGGDPVLVRSGDTVVFSSNMDLKNLPGGDVVVGYIPSGYRPVQDLIISKITNQDADFRIYVYRNGSIHIYIENAYQITNGAFSMSWITQDSFPS